ncbi:MAG: N-acetylneuraminate synthase family protein [Phycisphaeraceae bacterium]|nr:N-acetylneuraminate synthase family protein [Phycisphaeraceae bacterium]
MEESMFIGDRRIQAGDPYIIAEIGVNHDGDAGRAIALTRSAAMAGADAVKLQFFRAEMLMSRASRLAAYQAGAGERDPAEMLRRLELGIDAMGEVVDEAHRLGLCAIVTVFSVELVPEADRLGWDAYKTASPDVIHRPLLEALMETGLPLIVSTGAAGADEVERAIGWLERAGDRLALLQCVSCYPTADGDASIGAMAALRAMFDGPVGYSDHTAGTRAGAIAAACGAAVLEKHLTWSNGAAGPDHAASLEPEAFAEYVESAHEAAEPGWTSDLAPDPRLGPQVKRVLDCERDVREASRQSIVSARVIPAGAPIGRGDVTFKRPGTGIPPHELGRVLASRARVEIAADVPIVDDWIEEGASDR